MGNNKKNLAMHFVRRDDQDSNAPAESDNKKEWTDLCDDLTVAKKLLKEKEKIPDNRFADREAREAYKSGQLEQALSRLVEVSEESAKAEAAYRRAGIILRGYYGQDKIYDFTMDLLESWGQELSGEDPDLYAKELYNNSLINIRRLFQQMQDKLRNEESAFSEQSSKTPFIKRLTALERYHFSDSDLNEFAKALRKTQRLYKQLSENLAKDEIPESSAEYQEFAASAQHLAALFLNKDLKITARKLEAFANSILEVVEGEDGRIARMKTEIDRANELYSRLCDTLAKEDVVRLMDSLNPKAGDLTGKPCEEIRSQYCPLIGELRKITEEYKK